MKAIIAGRVRDVIRMTITIELMPLMKTSIRIGTVRIQSTVLLYAIRMANTSQDTANSRVKLINAEWSLVVYLFPEPSRWDGWWVSSKTQHQ